MSCAQQLEEGIWVATDANDGIPRVVLRFNCQDQVLNGEPYPPGPPWYVHLWGNCSPSDCDWGEVGGRRLNNGVIYSTYDHGFAKRGVHIQATSTDELWLYVFTHFVDGSGRADYETEQLLHREPGSLVGKSGNDELELFRRVKVPKGQFRTATKLDSNPVAREGLRDSIRRMPSPPLKR